MPHAAVRFDGGTGATLLREGAAQNETKRVWATYGLQRTVTPDTVGAESVSVSVTVCMHSSAQLQDHHRGRVGNAGLAHYIGELHGPAL